jgi:hypothetical protein
MPRAISAVAGQRINTRNALKHFAEFDAHHSLWVGPMGDIQTRHQEIAMTTD